MKKIILLVFLGLSTSIFAQVASAPEDVSPLLIGEKIPTLNLHDSKGVSVSTETIFNKKTVLIVYRGGWCPYCNAQLADMQSIEKDIIELGFQVVAVSPDSPESIKETEGKDKLGYQLFSDSDGTFIKSLGIAFKAPEKYSGMLGKFSGGKNNSILPVPTVYVVNEKKEIQFLFINPDYKTRLKGNLLLAVLKNL